MFIRRFMESFNIRRMRIVTLNHLEKLRRSAMSIAANAPWTFVKLRRSGMFIRRLWKASFCFAYALGP